MKRTKRDIIGGKVSDDIYKAARIIDNNTIRFHTNNVEHIQLHNTVIIRKFPNGDTQFDTGGWRTVTTKDRMNKYSDFSIWSDKGIWYIRHNPTSWEKRDEFPTYYYYDGIIIGGDGKIVSEELEPDMAKVKRIKRQIAEYVKLITKDNLPMPSQGDCYYCLFHQIGNNTNHLQSHLDEKYLHGSILCNAMREKGWNDTQISCQYAMKLVCNFRRAVRAYLIKHLKVNEG